MAAVKIQKFLGAAPKIASELLPDGAGQTAYNVKLYSGDLLPYRETTVVDSVNRLGETKTLYGLSNPANGVLAWLSWTTDVDVVTASDSSDEENRVYYTGDGAPKVTYYERAIDGSEPYPANYYDLGLPLPDTTPVATEASFMSSTSASYARDAGNEATIVTGTVHGLRTGNVVSIRGFTGAIPSTFNATNVTITVTDTTTFTYYSAGDYAATTADVTATVDLAGNTQTRTYVYTWYTPWGEESIGSDPSGELYIKEGQQVAVTSLPTAPPAGDNYTRGIRLYRTLSSTSGTEYYLLGTCWFPRATTLVSLTSNVATVTLDDHHNMIVGDKFKLQGCTDSTFDIIDGEVTALVGEYAFSYAVVAGDIAENADTTGTLFYNISELIADDPRYFQDNSIGTSLRERTSNVSTMTTAAAHNLVSNQIVTISGMTDATFDEVDVVITVTSTTAFTYPNTGGDEVSAADTGGLVTNNSFLDDFDYLNLLTALDTYSYDEPPAALQGITVGSNNMIMGFFDNQLCFAEPAKPHAWPLKYRRTMEYDIIALSTVGGYTIVLTEQFAYRISGNDPSTVSVARIDTPYPCLSKRSVVNMGYGVLYATHGGLALWSPSTGLALATKYIHDWDTWEAEVDPSTIVGTFYDDKYLGSHSTGAFIFERDEKVGGYYVTSNNTFTAVWTNPVTSDVYAVNDYLGNITLWDDASQPARPLEWKSKTVVTKDYINLGAARVVANYALSAAEIAILTAYNDGVVAYNTALWTNAAQLGTINGPVDYTEGGIRVSNFGEFNGVIIHGDTMTRSARTIPTTYDVTFRLWVNEVLTYTNTLSSDAIFRLPTGYRSDTFEVAVSGSARIKSIHLGETPYGLRTA